MLRAYGSAASTDRRAHLPCRDVEDEADDSRAREVRSPDWPRAARAAHIDQAQAVSLDLDVMRLDADLRDQESSDEKRTVSSRQRSRSSSVTT